MYNFDEQPATVLAGESQKHYDEILTHDVCCLIGPNNSGKSFLLKKMTEQLKGKGTYLGPARYSNFNTLAPYSPKKGRKQKKFQDFINTFRNNTQNIDNSPFNIQQAIAELSNEGRDNLFDMVEGVMGAKLTLALADPDNSMSQRYVSADGHNFAFASSGTRLIVSILASLLDSDFSHFLIDEPELGVSPESQSKLVEFILNADNRRKYFPHISNLVFATHSTIFLNRVEISKNYTVRKDGDVIRLERLASLADFNRIHFSLLGNSLQKLFLPNLILFVEGPSEETFLSRALQIRYPSMSFSIINATGDAEMKRYAHMLSQIFPDLQNSPYRDRVIPVLDKVHGSGIVDRVVAKGIPEASIVVWSKNGVENFYPSDAMDIIFGAGGNLSIIGDEVARNGTKVRKMDLVARVASMLTEKTKHHPELVEKLFNRIDQLQERT